MRVTWRWSRSSSQTPCWNLVTFIRWPHYHWFHHTTASSLPDSNSSKPWLHLSLSCFCHGGFPLLTGSEKIKLGHERHLFWVETVVFVNFVNSAMPTDVLLPAHPWQVNARTRSTFLHHRHHHHQQLHFHQHQPACPPFSITISYMLDNPLQPPW